QHHRSQRRAREIDYVPTDPAVDDGGSKGKRRTIGFLPRRRPFPHQVRGERSLGAHLTGDELIHILDGTATVEIVGEDGPQSFALRAGMIIVIPQGAWHRLHSSEGATIMTATPFPGEHIELDV